MNIEWDAKKYTDDFSFVPQYGAGVIDLIDLTKARTCLDLGCGNGALTAELQRRGLRVTGLDASPELLQIARAQHSDIPFMEADAASFALREPVDAVFSNAVFHWIDRERQMAMLCCVKKALRPGGQFVFEFGGKGNTARIHSALAAAFSARGHAYRMPFYFPSIGEYASLLDQIVRQDPLCRRLRRGRKRSHHPGSRGSAQTAALSGRQMVCRLRPTAHESRERSVRAFWKSKTVPYGRQQSDAGLVQPSAVSSQPRFAGRRSQVAGGGLRRLYP